MVYASLRPLAQIIFKLIYYTHTKGTWQGDTVSFEKTAVEIARSITDIVQGRSKNRDNLSEVNPHGEGLNEDRQTQQETNVFFTSQDIEDILFFYEGAENENEGITYVLKFGEKKWQKSRGHSRLTSR